MPTVADMRGVGVKHGGNYADVLYGRLLSSLIQARIHCIHVYIFPCELEKCPLWLSE